MAGVPLNVRASAAECVESDASLPACHIKKDGTQVNYVLMTSCLIIFRLAACVLMVGTAFAGAINVNGTCELGNCVTPDTLGIGDTLSDPFDFIYVFGNGDQFQIQGVLSGRNTSGTIWTDAGTQFTITYLGNGASAAPSAADVFSIHLLQNFVNAGVTSGTFGADIHVGFGGPLTPAGSSAARQLFLGSTPQPLLGPFSPPPALFSASFSDFPISGLGNPLLFDNRFSVSFGAGSNPGATIIFSLPQIFLPPAITTGGVVPIFSSSTTIQPGSWVSIYGNNLAGPSTEWNGNFPTTLGGVEVTIDSKPAYLWYVSPTQINLQAPDDVATGDVDVVVTTLGGSARSTVALAQYSPSFLLLDNEHVTGIISRSNGSGAYGGGTYDIIGPTGNSLGYRTVAAEAGDSITLFAVGLGPTVPVVQPGKLFSGAAPTTNPVSLLIQNVSVTPSFAGLSEAGLYQINLTVPAGLGAGDVPLVATVGAAQTQPGVVISLQ
jgi:uncharacterized protein (TIGR03437 family)